MQATLKVPVPAVEELEKAVEHLEKAKEQVEQGRWSGPVHKAHCVIIYAANSARHAVDLLKQEKGE